MRDSYRLRSMLAAGAVLVIAAGCAQGGGGATVAPTQVAVASAAPSGGPAGSPETYTLTLHQDPTLGMILTGDDGKTLYELTKDSAGTTTCTGSCATNWPPFTLAGGDTAVAGSGVTGTVTTLQRPDGGTQVALNGHPLYYFKGDSAAGDTNGEGVNGVWFAVGADGSAVQTPASSGGYHY
jgi:predicted lipoprotein with Yx(FWY)xxD motif